MLIKLEFCFVCHFYLAYRLDEQVWLLLGKKHEIHHPGENWITFPGPGSGAHQTRKEICLVLDNIDWDVKVHDIHSNKQNKSIHAVATSIVFDHVTSSHLLDNGQQKNLATCEK